MLSCNPLYYYPVESNRLYYSKKGTKEFRKAFKAMPSFEITGLCWAQYDKKANRLSRISDILLILAFILAFAAIAAAVVFAVSESFAAFMAVMTFFAAIVLLTPFILAIRKRLILYYLSFYKPVCEEWDEETLQRIGRLGLRVPVKKVEIEENCFYDKEEGDDFEFTDCACISCMRMVRNGEIKEFDSNNSAICPYCGKVSLMYNTGEISPDFLEKLHVYWSMVHSLKSQE